MKSRLLALLLLTTLLLPGNAWAIMARKVPTLVRVTVRVFVDLECPYSRQAWPRYRQATDPYSGATLVIQHLPLSAHPLAMTAAVAAVAARAQGKEGAFLDALFQEAKPDEAAIQRAAAAAQLDLALFDGARTDAKLQSQVVMEQQSALALGIRSTPSALVNGAGLGGVPQVAVLQRAIQRARRLAGALPPSADFERLALVAKDADFVPALDAVRKARALAKSAQPSGMLADRWQVTVTENDLTFGQANAPLTIVLFVDPARTGQLGELARLLQLQAEEAKAGRADIRVVAKLLLPDTRGAWQKGTLPAALWLAAAALAAPPKAALLLRDLAQKVATAADLATHSATLGLDAAVVRKNADAPAATAWLQLSADLARRTDAVPGAIFVNGRRWLGLAGDDALHAALDDLRAEWKALSAKPATSYAALVAGGRYLQDVDLDLAAAETSNPSDVAPANGKTGQPVALFVDFRSPHSRAAFYMLRRLVTSKDLAIRLTLAVIPHGAEPGLTPSGAAILAATQLGKGLELAEALFNADKPDDWPTILAAAKKCKLDPATLKKTVALDPTQTALRQVWQARQELDMRDEPAIFIGNRPYQGPLDEARLERAVRYVRDQSSPPSAPAGSQP